VCENKTQCMITCKEECKWMTANKEMTRCVKSVSDCAGVKKKNVVKTACNGYARQVTCMRETVFE
jgi:hypothetical protein